MAGAVFHVPDQRAGFAGRFKKGVGQFQVGALAPAANVVHLAHATILPDAINGGAVVANVDPIADVEPVPVNGNALVAEEIADKKWDELLRELKGPVFVRAGRDQGGHAKGRDIT